MNYHPGTTDIKSRGNAFDIPPRSTNPDSHTPPAKRGPKKKTKAQESASVLRTDEERSADRIAARTEKILAFRKSIVTFSPNPQADSDNTARISGRANGRRTQ